MGYTTELEWQNSRDLSALSESAFLEEAAWVILSTGLREIVVRRRFPKISQAFMNWVSAELIAQNRSSCEAMAIKVFNNSRKIPAIGSICERVALMGLDTIREHICKDGFEFLQEFDFIGPVIRYHLAKNTGLDVVKPDCHLVRIANAARCDSPIRLCQVISDATGEKLSVVDLVLWRYATIDPQYIDLFRMRD